MATVLVVEDEATVLMLAQSYITELGYETVCAASGEEALALVDGERRIDLLFTDIGLSDGPRGFEIATAARERWPDLKVLYASGQPLTDGMMALFVEGSRFLPKPYSVEQLEAEIKTLLD
jgi:CheY-like chemotaxis protein